MESVEYDTMAQLEEHYWWYRGLRGLVAKALQSQLGTRRMCKILDAGCGTGGGLRATRIQFPDSFIVGTDVATSAIRHAARRQTNHLVRGSINELPFRDKTFDAVLSIDVLYIQGVEDMVALQELRRVLRPGGVLIVNVPAFEWLRGAHDVAVHTRHRYRRGEFAQLLETEGFAVKRVIYWNALLLPVVFVARRLLCRQANGRSDLRRLPGSLNWALTQVLAFDTSVCSKVRMPFGTSIFSVASKPMDSAHGVGREAVGTLQGTSA